MANRTYNPGVFRVPNQDAARRIILTPEPGATTEDRWVRETPYVAGLAVAQLTPSADSLVIDFGCGIGRLAKELIARTGCTVLGVDISPEMRGLAPAYVQSDRFSVVSPEVFDEMIARGLRADAAFSVWVLQHVLSLPNAMRRLRGVIRPGGRLFVVNDLERIVPVVPQEGLRTWASDGLDIKVALAEAFRPLAIEALDPIHMGERLARSSFWGTYEAVGG